MRTPTNPHVNKNKKSQTDAVAHTTTDVQRRTDLSVLRNAQLNTTPYSITML